jgi:hypothetical protein
MSEVEPVPVEWLWNPYVPLGKLTLLEGDPGCGKTWLSLTITAIVSRGDPFPDLDGIPRLSGEPANILYLSAEDGLADTLRPRLDSAGADVNRVHVLTGKDVRSPGADEPQVVGITLKDIPVLEEALRRVKPRLLIVDPLQAYLGEKVDMHRANEVRPILAALARLAESYCCAVLCIRHLTKDPKGTPLYRGLGSIDFTAAARSVLQVKRHPLVPGSRGIVHIKSSLAKEGPSIGFEVKDAKFLWTGKIDLSLEALLRGEGKNEQSPDDENNAIEEAAAFLRRMLANGARLSEEILREARRIGISEKTLRRAKKQARVRSRRRSEQGKPRGTGDWEWYLQPGQVIPFPIKDPVDHHEEGSQPPNPQQLPLADQDSSLATLKDQPVLQGSPMTELDEPAKPLIPSVVTGQPQDGQQGQPENGQNESNDDSEVF